MTPTDPPTQLFAGLTDLASAAFGGRALLASDEFFAGKEHLLDPAEPAFRPDTYTDRGKDMDGWEPRRRRHPGHDWCIVKLGVPGQLAGLDLDTRHFLGNQAPFASLDATVAEPDATGEWLRDQADWTRVLDPVPLAPGSHNAFALRAVEEATHVRLNIYPAGGVARMRVYGRPQPPPTDQRVDLASARRGGRALACSDMFFSRVDNLLLPGDAETMGQGWETRRSPWPRQDWAIVALGQRGLLDQIELDTRHFKGNYPVGARIEAIDWPGAPPRALALSEDWTEVVAESPLGAHQSHALPVAQPGPWTHLRLTLLSDGGVSRLRAWGRPAASEGPDDALLRWLNEGPADQVAAAFSRCCGAQRWVAAMLDGRPYLSRAHLHGYAEDTWWHLGEGDWREAFTHHPRIGADVDKLRQKFGQTASWSEGEQSGVQGADEAVIQALAAGNRAYEERYGYIFIVCASGLSAREMLDRLEARMDNPPDAELRIAAGEQRKITRLRLDKLEVPQ